MDSDKLTKIIIPRQIRPLIRLKLNNYGINQETMFPDLDGTCKHLTWRFRNRVGYWEP